MKRLVCLFLLFTCLCLCCGAAVAEDALKFDTSREIAAYLDQEDVKYAVKTDREKYDLFTLTYAPSSSKELDKIAIQVYAYEDSAVVIGADLLQPDTSNLLKLYQNLESMNDSALCTIRTSRPFTPRWTFPTRRTLPLATWWNGTSILPRW